MAKGHELPQPGHGWATASGRGHARLHDMGAWHQLGGQASFSLRFCAVKSLRNLPGDQGRAHSQGVGHSGCPQVASTLVLGPRDTHSPCTWPPLPARPGRRAQQSESDTLQAICPWEGHPENRLRARPPCRREGRTALLGHTCPWLKGSGDSGRTEQGQAGEGRGPMPVYPSNPPAARSMAWVQLHRRHVSPAAGQGTMVGQGQCHNHHSG